MNKISKIKYTIKKENNKTIVFTVSSLYLILYLISIRDIQITQESTGIEFGSVSNIIKSSGFLQYEAVVKIILEPILFLISPINVFIGSLIGFLVALNIILVYTILKQPKKCNISDTAGIMGSILSLLSGSACCGPILPIILGLQITGTFSTLIDIAIPLSVILLITTIYIMLRRI